MSRFNKIFYFVNIAVFVAIAIVIVASIVNAWNAPNNNPPYSTNQAMYISSTGNVGIGTTTPSTRLDVDGNIAVGAPLSPAVISADGGVLNVRGTADVAVHTDSDNDGGGAILFQKGAVGTPTEFMRIVNDGNVGIGTASPQTKLHVAGQIKADGGTPIYSCPVFSYGCPGSCDGGLSLSPTCVRGSSSDEYCRAWSGATESCTLVGRMVAP